MVKTIVLKSERGALTEAVRHVDEQLKDCIADGPVELWVSVDELDGMMKTMEVLFDRTSIERIRQARHNWYGQSLIS